MIAIIAILAAILFPVFAQAREKARAIACTSNEKQLALAMMQYQQDYDETFPSGDPGFYSPNGRGWAARIYPYVKSTGVYKCPDDPTAASGNLVPVSHGINCNLAAPFGPPLNNAGLSAPTNTVLFFEVQGARDYVNDPNGDDQSALIVPASSVGADGGDEAAGFIDGITGAMYATGAMGQPEHYRTANVYVSETEGRHQQGSNFALADGHVKFLRRNAVSSGYPANTPNQEQDQATEAAVGISGYSAAGTATMGQAPANFAATFSPI